MNVIQRSIQRLHKLFEVQQAVKLAQNSTPSARITWPSGFVVEDVMPVKDQQHNIVNRAGRIVLRGIFQGRPIKLYEAASTEHAIFIQKVSESYSISEILPEVLERYEHCIAAEWVPGITVGERMEKECDSSMLKGLARMQARIHAIPADTLPHAHFDYWHEYIRNRFLKVSSLLGCNQLAAEICSRIDEVWDNSPKVLMHPDLTPANTVNASHGVLKVIDNELLCVGGIPLIDVCNLVSSLSPSLAIKYVDLYLVESGRHSPSGHELEALRCIWLARQIGARMVSGHIHELYSIIEKFTAGQSILPWQGDS